MANGFDPVGAFQGARRNALAIQKQEQAIDAESAAAPKRNQLADLKLQQAKTQQGQQQTTFDQQQAMSQIQFGGQAAQALRSLPIQQRRAAVQALTPQFQKFGLDPSQFTDDQLTDAELDDDIAQFQAFQQQAPVSALDQARTAKLQAETAIVGQPKPTTLEQNLISAGLTPGTPEFQAAALKAVNKPATAITLGSEKKFQEKVAEGQAKTFGRVGEEADAAIDANQSLDVLESIDVNTGALEPAKQGIAAFAAAFGIDATGLANVSQGEAFNAEAQRIVLAVKASQKGPQTDKDEATIRKTVANLGNSKAGNQFIIDSARALNNRRIERKSFYDNFIEEAGGSFKDESGKTADKAWSEFKRGTPMISSKLRTPEGLPVFFYKFETDVRNANPDATRAEIMEAWRAANRGAN